MDRGSKQEFDFSITYFKDTGKFYTDTLYRWVCATVGGTNPAPTPYMNDIVAHIRGLRGSGSPLPGLIGTDWDGYIVVVHADGYPTLILPPGTSPNG